MGVGEKGCGVGAGMFGGWVCGETGGQVGHALDGFQLGRARGWCSVVEPPAEPGADAACDIVVAAIRWRLRVGRRFCGMLGVWLWVVRVRLERGPL